MALLLESDDVIRDEVEHGAFFSLFLSVRLMKALLDFSQLFSRNMYK